MAYGHSQEYNPQIEDTNTVQVNEALRFRNGLLHVNHSKRRSFIVANDYDSKQ